MWIYLYSDGRLISTGIQIASTGNGWRERRLTPDGVELVQDEIIASGLFDPDQPPPVNGLERPSDIEVRNGDWLVVVAWAPDRPWSSDFLRLVERLRNLQSWLPADAWADAEATTYVPDRYAICAHITRMRDIVSLLPAAAAELLDTAPLLEVTPEMDQATYERSPLGDHLCFDLTREQAQSLAASLNEELTPNRNLWVEVGAEDAVEFVPILPPGAPECACYG